MLYLSLMIILVIIIEIGIGLIAFGCGFTTLGVFLFFDRALLAMGNLMFLSGVTTTIGPRATMKFFIKPRNQRGAFCFILGLLLVLMKWAVVGMIIECYGFFALFAGFFPTVLLFLQRVPVLGTMLRFPGVNQFVKKIVKKGQRLPVWCWCWCFGARGCISFFTELRAFARSLLLSFKVTPIISKEFSLVVIKSLFCYIFIQKESIIIRLMCFALSAVATCTARFSSSFLLPLPCLLLL